MISKSALIVTAITACLICCTAPLALEMDDRTSQSAMDTPEPQNIPPTPNDINDTEKGEPMPEEPTTVEQDTVPENTVPQTPNGSLNNVTVTQKPTGPTSVVSSEP